MYSNPDLHDSVLSSLFDHFDSICEGTIAVDKEGRISWINAKYRKLLGIEEGLDVIGIPIEDIIPESRMRKVVESGQPTLLDIMRFSDQYFVVIRLPLIENNEVIGAIGFVLFDNLNYLKPIIQKFELLQQRLTEAEKLLAAERRARYGITNIVGVSPAITAVKNQALAIAQHDSAVLITGETGTGKELLAQSIHSASVRRNGAFVAVNVAAVPETLLEAEFFGVAPGAYTDAGKKERPGKFALAEGGTLFLDEIGDMPLNLQSKLLRVLEEQEYEPIGSNKVHKTNVRIIAATSQDLETKKQRGEFRKDLFYRINVLPLNIPPLRERLDDIKPLSAFFLEKFSSQTASAAKIIDDEGVAFLQTHDWPGNIRELKNVIERVCLLANAPVLSAADVKPFMPQNKQPQPQIIDDDFDIDAALSLPAQIEALEKKSILRALEMTSGKKAPAARMLGISRSQLYDKLRDYHMPE